MNLTEEIGNHSPLPNQKNKLSKVVPKDYGPLIEAAEKIYE